MATDRRVIYAIFAVFILVIIYWYYKRNNSEMFDQLAGIKYTSGPPKIMGGAPAPAKPSGPLVTDYDYTQGKFLWKGCQTRDCLFKLQEYHRNNWAYDSNLLVECRNCPQVASRSYPPAVPKLPGEYDYMAERPKSTPGITRCNTRWGYPGEKYTSGTC